jgi:hypothetical protein
MEQRTREFKTVDRNVEIRTQDLPKRSMASVVSRTHSLVSQFTKMRFNIASDFRQTRAGVEMMKYSSLVEVLVSLYNIAAALLLKLDMNSTSEYNDSLIFPVGVYSLFTRYSSQGYEPSGGC